MECSCINWFRSTYEKLDSTNEEDIKSYETTNEVIDKMLIFNPETEKKIKKIKGYFEQFCNLPEDADIPNKADIIAKARIYAPEMDSCFYEFVEYTADLNNASDTVDQSIEKFKHKLEKFRIHGCCAGVIGAILLACIGGIISWQIFGIKSTTNMALGVAVGFVVGVFAFAIFSFWYRGQQKTHLSKWEVVKKKMSEPAINKEIIEQRELNTRQLSVLLEKLLGSNLTDDTIRSCSKKIVQECDEYLLL